jgi:hypothetical protein
MIYWKVLNATNEVTTFRVVPENGTYASGVKTIRVNDQMPRVTWLVDVGPGDYYLAAENGVKGELFEVEPDYTPAQPRQSSKPSKPSNRRVIAAALVASFIMLGVLAIMGFLLWRRRNRRRVKDEMGKFPPAEKMYNPPANDSRKVEVAASLKSPRDDPVLQKGEMMI